MINRKSKIYVAGHRGMVGSAIVRRLEAGGYTNILTRTRLELDLADQHAVFDFLARERPDYIFLAAAKVGGIHANDTLRADFIYQNLAIEANIIHGAYRAGIQRLLFLGSSCIYPRDCPQPIKEEYLLTGPLEQTNEPYAIAKIAGIKLCESYNRQYGTRYAAVMPTNLYGPNDHYDLTNSHVLPALIRKAHLIKLAAAGNIASIEADEANHGDIPPDLKQDLLATFNSERQPLLRVWGTGQPRREFLHVDDLADACVFLMEKGSRSLAGCKIRVRRKVHRRSQLRNADAYLRCGDRGKHAGTMMDMTVVCFQARLTHYREALFVRLRHRLAEKKIAFELVHGLPDTLDKAKNDSGSLPWARVVEARKLRLGRFTGVWLPTPHGLPRPDMVIVTQENRLLANYAWLARRALHETKVAFWGHGINFQSDNPKGLRERWKRLILTRVDWWFAYTELTRDIVQAAGYPNERITVLDNAIDNEGFRADLDSVSDDEAAALRGKLSHGGTPRIGLFCGSLYPDKRIGFMIEAADRIRAQIPNFSLVVIGDGPSAHEVKAAAAGRPWLHWVGARRGREKAAYFRVADVVLNPGSVGLHVLDSFCAGVPMVTTSDAKHGPEIAYLKDGENGLVVRGGVVQYANAVVELLEDQARHASLRSAALAAAKRYSLDNMVDRFCDGIVRCLEMGKYR